MKKEDMEKIKAIDRHIDSLKKDMLRGDFKINKESKAIIRMIKIKINELDSIARLIQDD
jgi:hypothetical protein